MIQDEELRALIELGGKATERPWLVSGFEVYAPGRGCVADLPTPNTDGCFEVSSNASFIAASANLAVPLAEECLRLRAEVTAMREERERAGYTPDPRDYGVNPADASEEDIRAQ